MLRRRILVPFVLCEKSTSVAEQYVPALAFCCIVITAIVATIAAVNTTTSRIGPNNLVIATMAIAIPLPVCRTAVVHFSLSLLIYLLQTIYLNYDLIITYDLMGVLMDIPPDWTER